jgi:serine/threonine protein kinase/Tol biopolymer transport system component
MTLEPGNRIKHYEIISKLGAGGMGEVYKAHDTTLGRAAALKILPASVADDEDRMRRFVQEAKSASALNHPHIVTIYEVGQTQGDGDLHYIAMEYIEGETLTTTIHRQRAPLKKLIELLAQAADGLAKAHAAGIVHRDLKPDNIMISVDGYAKILDFGLAKLTETKKPSGQPQEEAETMMMQKTQPGMVMGTIGYMSPEQVQGKEVDHRSDIFSFGCILYEAATGKKPFEGESIIDSMHKIVYAQAPPIVEINPEVPAELQRIIRKCLAKGADERYQSIKEVNIDLRDLVREYESQPTSGSHAAQSTAAYPQATDTGSQAAVTTGPQPIDTITGQSLQKSFFRRWIVWVVASLILIAAGVFAVIKLTGRISPLDPFEVARVSRLTTTGKVTMAVISPDGKYAAHVVDEAGQRSIWTRQVATSSNVPIVPPSDAQYIGLTFSADGNYVYYVRQDKGSLIRFLYQIPVLGGAPQKIVEDVDSRISFSPSGDRFAFVRNYNKERESVLLIANADGTGERKLATLKIPDQYQIPAWSPDGSVIACSTLKVSEGRQFSVDEIRVADGAHKTFTSRKWQAIAGLEWRSDGRSLMMTAVDRGPTSNQLQVWQLSYPAGEARRVTNDLNNYAGISLTADSKTLVTVQTEARMNVWAAPGGKAADARQITSGTVAYNYLSCAPDGRIVYQSSASSISDIWIMNADGTGQKQLTANAGINVFPMVSPDGRHIVFCSNRGGDEGVFHVWRIDIDGNNPKQLTSGEGEYFPAVSADGKWVFYNHIGVTERTPMLWRAPIDGGEGKAITDFIAVIAVPSPDGKYIACRYSDGKQPGLKTAIIPVEGGQPVKMFNFPPFSSNPQLQPIRWTADSKALTWLEERGGVWNVWIQPLSGGEAKQATDFKTDQIFSFAWTKDGTLIATRGVVTNDVVLMSNSK